MARVPDLLALTLAAIATILATGLGALPVAALGPRRVQRVHAGLSGLAAGAMAVAAVVGLLIPGLDKGDVLAVGGGAAAGVGGLLVLRRTLGVRRHGERSWLVVAIVLFAHSLPEGFAIGTAVGSGEAGLGLFVVLAIAFQNVPEGIATAMPMQEAGHRPAAQVWAAIGTSVPQLPGALIAFWLVETVERLLPVSFGFAAGAMLALVVTDLAPDALTLGHRGQGLAGAAAGAVAMLILAEIAGV
jgi:zinc transporter, ZIP family